MILRISTSWFPISGTGSSKIATSKKIFTRRSTVCRCIRPCGPDAGMSRSGWEPRAPARCRRRGGSTTCWAPASGFFLNSAVYFSSYPPPGPGRLLALLAVVRERGQGHADGLLFVSPPRTQSSMLSPLCSSCDGLPAEVHLTTVDANKKSGHFWDKRLVVVVVVVVVVRTLCYACVSVHARALCTIKNGRCKRTRSFSWSDQPDKSPTPVACGCRFQA